MFLEAGAKHVICIKSGEKISDKASIRFAEVFYESLFAKEQKYNVCSAFQIAKNHIKLHCSESEANKFLCKYPETKVHFCSPFINPVEGKLEDIDKKMIFNIVPT